jgi:hypothetical protein
MANASASNVALRVLRGGLVAIELHMRFREHRTGRSMRAHPVESSKSGAGGCAVGTTTRFACFDPDDRCAPMRACLPACAPLCAPLANAATAGSGRVDGSRWNEEIHSASCLVTDGTPKSLTAERTRCRARSRLDEPHTSISFAAGEFICDKQLVGTSRTAPTPACTAHPSKADERGHREPLRYTRSQYCAARQQRANALGVFSSVLRIVDALSSSSRRHTANFQDPPPFSF